MVLSLEKHISSFLYEIEQDLLEGGFLEYFLEKGLFNFEHSDYQLMESIAEDLSTIYINIEKYYQDTSKYTYLIESAKSIKNLSNEILTFLDKKKSMEIDSSQILFLFKEYMEIKFALILDYESPSVFEIFKFLGLLEDTLVFIDDGVEENENENYDVGEARLKLDAFSLLFSDPGQLFRNEYIINDDAFYFLSRKFYSNLDTLFLRLGILPEHEEFGMEFDGEIESADEISFVISSDLDDLYGEESSNTDFESTKSLGVGLNKVYHVNEGKEGLLLFPFVSFEGEYEYELDSSIKFYTNITGDYSALSFVLWADKLNIDTLTNTYSAFAEVGVVIGDGNEFILIGQKEKSRLSFQTLSSSLFLNLSRNTNELGVKLYLEKLKLVIDASEGDGFISSILSAIDTEAEANLSLGWSTLSGFTLEGGANLQVQLNTHIDLGILKVTALIISLGPEEKSLGLDVGANIELNLGPLKATIKDIGLDSNLLFEPGNLGPVNLDTGFKPPSGVGLSIDAAVIKGGGYLAFDKEREEYTGALELVINEFINVKAIGVITTRMPDGSKGFSMLLVLTAEFSTGLQLGMGFTLNGVGGLLGLNRTVNRDALIDSITTGGAQKIMFPKDVIANAPRIISDLQTFFPTKKDTFLIGPMARLGWGTPTLVTLDLGVIIELPDVNTIVILGKLALNLPDADSPLLKLNIVFMGMFEADKQRAWFYGQLVDSKLLTFTLEGGMGFLVEWDNDPEFIITAGGFHPQYKPPGTLPAPFLDIPRMGISILDEPWGKIRAVSYFAVTSNTVQMGALAELYFKFGPFQVKGHIGYDALFQFDPFFFIIDVSAGVSVKFFGAGLFAINLEFSLQGPTPWRVKGYGSIKILFIRLRARFDETWGDALDNTHLEPIDVTKLLVEQLESPANWRPILPASSHLLVSLRTTESDGDNLLLHPVGSLAVSQTAVPLNFDLDRVGQQQPQDYDHFELTPADGVGLEVDKETLKAPFAIAQYKDLSNEEKLSMQSFDKLPSGISIGSAQGNQTVRAVNRVIRYETEIMDCNGQQTSIGLMGIGREFFGTVVMGSATYKSELSVHVRSKIVTAPKFTFAEEVYVLVNKTNNKVHQQDEQELLFDTEAEAFDFMKREERSNPRLKGQLLVVPEFDREAA